MKALMQKVNFSKLTIEDELYSKIDKGMLILLGIEKGDTTQDIEYLVNKLYNLRVFEDENEKMNLSISDVNGEMMIVSQFTLCADCSSGNRPSFVKAENPKEANEIYELFIQKMKEKGITVATGKFGAYMKINFENDGPVTIMLESKK